MRQTIERLNSAVYEYSIPALSPHPKVSYLTKTNALSFLVSLIKLQPTFFIMTFDRTKKNLYNDNLTGSKIAQDGEANEENNWENIKGIYLIL